MMVVHRNRLLSREANEHTAGKRRIKKKKKGRKKERKRFPASMKLNLIPASRPLEPRCLCHWMRDEDRDENVAATPRNKSRETTSGGKERVNAFPGARDWPDILLDPATHIANYQLYDPLALLLHLDLTIIHRNFYKKIYIQLCVL